MTGSMIRPRGLLGVGRRQDVVPCVHRPFLRLHRQRRPRTPRHFSLLRRSRSPRTRRRLASRPPPRSTPVETEPPARLATSRRRTSTPPAKALPITTPPPGTSTRSIVPPLTLTSCPQAMAASASPQPKPASGSNTSSTPWPRAGMTSPNALPQWAPEALSASMSMAEDKQPR